MLPKSEKLCFDILTAIDEIQDFLAEASQASFTQSLQSDLVKIDCLIERKVKPGRPIEKAF